VVPRIGLEHIAVGRKEVTALYRISKTLPKAVQHLDLLWDATDLESFMLQPNYNHAMERGFVVADADLSQNADLENGQVWQLIVS